MIRAIISVTLVLMIAQLRQQTTQVYVPPLTHVPELSMGLLGEPAAQPRFMLANLCQLQPCEQKLMIRHQQLLLKGKMLRLEMQHLSAQLSAVRPALDLSAVVRHRPTAEQSYGELKSWQRLPQD